MSHELSLHAKDAVAEREILGEWIESVVARHDRNFPREPTCISVGGFLCAK
jgi:hypothetical protein